MKNPPRIREIAIGSMLWSVLFGAGTLTVMLVACYITAAAPFPMEFVAFYVCVETLLTLILWGVLQRRRQTRVALSLLLILIAAVTLLSTNLALNFVLSIEAVWLAPWVFTAYLLWRSEQP